MYSHSATEQPCSPRTKSTKNRLHAHPLPARRPIYRIRPANNTFFDTGADGDTETTSTKSRRIHKSQRNTNWGKLLKQTLQSCSKSSHSNPRKRTLDSLDFLSSYDDKQPSALDRRNSKTADPSRAKKRRKIADPTYRATKGISSEEDLTGAVEKKVLQKPIMKKRKRIADPTFRPGVSSDSEEGVVERPRKRSKKRVGTQGKGLPTSLSKNVGQKLRAESDMHEMHGDAKDTEAPVSREAEQRPYMQEVEERGVSGGDDDDEEFVWERDWCRVM
jgi:hypothetical protein